MEKQNKINALLAFKKNYSVDTLDCLDELLFKGIISQSQYGYLCREISMYYIYDRNRNDKVSLKWIDKQLKLLTL